MHKDIDAVMRDDLQSGIVAGNFTSLSRYVICFETQEALLKCEFRQD